jgi:two-component sensor histidine kinase
MGPERHPSALGQRGRECWAEIWDIIGPQVEQVLTGKGATWHEDELVPVTRFGERQDVWWTYGYSPIDDEASPGGIGGVLVICNDITEQHLARERLRALFQQAPGFIAILRGSDHVFDLVNDAYSELVGNRDVVGLSVRRALPEVVDQGMTDLLDQVLASGEAFAARSRPVILRTAGGDLEKRYLDFVYQPIFGPDGATTGIFVQGHDVTDHRIAEEHRQLLVNELNHRVKNTLAIVQAIAGQTFRGGEAIEQAREAFTARLMSLSRAQDILTVERWRGADLRKIIAEGLDHHAGGGDRIALEGPAVRLSPRAATAMAMAVHELSTNAAKYGALSVPEGRVEVAWEIHRSEKEEERFTFCWKELGGPRVEKPAQKGFGSRLIERNLAAELSGEATIAYEPAGIICHIEAPLSGIEADLE